jgi:hypothetical protein
MLTSYLSGGVLGIGSLCQSLRYSCHFDTSTTHFSCHHRRDVFLEIIRVGSYFPKAGHIYPQTVVEEIDHVFFRGRSESVLWRIREESRHAQHFEIWVQEVIRRSVCHAAYALPLPSNGGWYTLH